MDLKDLGKKLKDGIKAGNIKPLADPVIPPQEKDVVREFVDNNQEIIKPSPEESKTPTTTVEITPDQIFAEIDDDVILSIKFTKEQCLELGTFLIKHS